MTNHEIAGDLFVRGTIRTWHRAAPAATGFVDALGRPSLCRRAGPGPDGCWAIARYLAETDLARLRVCADCLRLASQEATS